MADEILEATVAVDDKSAKLRADAERKRRERQAAAEASGRTYRPRRSKTLPPLDPKPLKVDAPLVKSDVEMEDIQPGLVGKDQARDNSSSPGEVETPFWHLLRSR